MNLFNSIGKRQIQQSTRFIGSAVGFGGAAFIGLLYMTEWRAILQNVPYLNTKWTDEKKE